MSGRTRRGNNEPQGGGGDGGGEPGTVAAAAPAAAPAGEEAPDYAQLLLAALNATNNVLAGLGTALQNLPADMAAAIPVPPSPPSMAAAGAAPPPPAAACSPFRAAGNTVLNFQSKEGKKFYEQATRSLFASDELFEVEPERFQLLLNRLNERARNLGMLGAGANTMVPPDTANPAVGTPINMITGHGQVTLAQKPGKPPLLAPTPEMIKTHKYCTI